MRKLFIAITLLIGFAFNGFAYDFTAVCESGQTLYYNVLSEDEKTVEVTYAEYYEAIYEQWWTYYWNVTAPEGDLIIPESVQFNESFYTVTKVGAHAFDKCDITSVTFPISVIEIGDYAFQPDPLGFVPLLTGELVLPEHLQTLGKNAFSGNRGITSVIIPNSVRKIGEGCFGSCEGLQSVTIGSGVEEIDYLAFANCTALETIIVDRAVPPTCQWSSFSWCPKDIPVLIPIGSKTLYEQAEYWNEFTNFIETGGLAIMENETNVFVAYPNPTEGEVFIDGDDINRVEVYSITGQFIKDFKTNVIDISDQESGAYLIKVIALSGSITKLIIKK